MQTGFDDPACLLARSRVSFHAAKGWDKESCCFRLPLSRSTTIVLWDQLLRSINGTGHLACLRQAHATWVTSLKSYVKCSTIVNRPKSHMFVVFPWPWGVRTFKRMSILISTLASKKLQEVRLLEVWYLVGSCNPLVLLAETLWVRFTYNIYHLCGILDRRKHAKSTCIWEQLLGLIQ